MLRSRTRLPLLAEISGPPEGARAWSLRRGDFEALEGALGQLEGQRVLLVSGRREAAPVAAIALAAAAAAGGRRTILVECDLAQPQLAAYVGLAAAPGLHEYLRWEAEPADVLQPVALGGSATDGSADPLACICGGRPASEAEALLGLQSFAHMIEKLRAAYELVLLSGPPPLEEPGPCAIAARQADAIVAGMPAAASSDRPLGKAIKRLPIPALGSIVVGT
jgi:succinoglycan biosynthesis transport protein ExoP